MCTNISTHCRMLLSVSMPTSSRMAPELSQDAQVARQSVVEGDATYFMTEYTETAAADLSVADLLNLATFSLSDAAQVPDSVPQALTDELLFPYNGGNLFVSALIEADGISLLNQAFTVNPPRSTEQILHPERYLNGDDPIDVTLADVSAQVDGAYTLQLEDVFGEFYLRQLLGRYLDDRSDSAITLDDAATGWGGDGYQVYRNDAGDVAWLLHIVSDTTDDAAELQGGFGAWVDAQSGMSGAGNGTVICGDVEDGSICQLDLADGVVIASAPDAETAIRFIEASQAGRGA